MDHFTILQQLTAAHGVSGGEGAVAQMLSALAAPYVDTCTTDALGNLICHKRGRGARVMLAAHMDSVGLLVTHIESTGFLRVSGVGGVRPKHILHAMVRFANGTVGTVSAPEDWDGDDFGGLYLDIGARDRAAAEQLVCVGDAAAYLGTTVSANGRILSPCLDDRIGCLALLMVMEQVSHSPNDLYFVFTVQEEVGLRGGRTAAFGIGPEYGLAVDVTGCDDTPESKHRATARLGDGAAVKAMDGSAICHPDVVRQLRQLAAEGDIPVQTDVLRRGGTDAGAMQLSGIGVRTGGVSIPCRYTHSPVEMVEWSDVEACARLVAAFAACPLPRLE